MIPEVPGNYTASQGRALIKWKNNFNINSIYTCSDDSKTIDY